RSVRVSEEMDIGPSPWRTRGCEGNAGRGWKRHIMFKIISPRFKGFQGGPHHQRVFIGVRVVAAAARHHREPHAAVERKSRLIGRTDFQIGGLAILAARLLKRLLHQSAGESQPPRSPIDCEIVDKQLLAENPVADVTPYWSVRASFGITATEA